jgi:hypothetical protein
MQADTDVMRLGRNGSFKDCFDAYIPKSLATFGQIVDERGERCESLRSKTFGRLTTAPMEHITVESRSATISIIVQANAHGSLRVVVQGFLKARFVPGSHVALDGFSEHQDESVTPMPDEEFYEFD